MKYSVKILLFSGFLLFFISPLLSQNHFNQKRLKDGDIIFHESKSKQSLALKLATHSRYTHTGIIFKVNKKWYVLEAVQPVKYTRLNNFIGRSAGNHFVIKRLKNRRLHLTPENIKKMKTVGRSFLGRNYDSCFEWTDKRIYCTELIWKIYNRALNIQVGSLEQLRDFDLTHPVVKKLLYKRYGKRWPLDQKVISPAAMFRAKNLVTIMSVN